MRQLTLLPELAEDLGRVYYGTDGLNVKIGWTGREPKRRGGELDIDMIYTEAGNELDERRHQRMWAEHRIGRGEWYRYHKEFAEWLLTRIPADDTRAITVLQQLVLLNNIRRAA